MFNNSEIDIMGSVVLGVIFALLFVTLAIVNIEHETKLEVEKETISFEIMRACLRHGNEWVHDTCIPVCN